MRAKSDHSERWREMKRWREREMERWREREMERERERERAKERGTLERDALDLEIVFGRGSVTASYRRYAARA